MVVAKDHFDNSAKLFTRRFQVPSILLILPAASVASVISNITSALLRGTVGAKKLSPRPLLNLFHFFCCSKRGNIISLALNEIQQLASDPAASSSAALRRE